MSSRRLQDQQIFGGFAPANFLKADSVTVNQPHVKDPFKLLTWSVRTKFCLKYFYFYKTNIPCTFLWFPNTPPTSLKNSLNLFTPLKQNPVRILLSTNLVKFYEDAKATIQRRFGRMTNLGNFGSFLR